MLQWITMSVQHEYDLLGAEFTGCLRPKELIAGWMYDLKLASSRGSLAKGEITVLPARVEAVKPKKLSLGLVSISFAAVKGLEESVGVEEMTEFNRWNFDSSGVLVPKKSGDPIYPFLQESVDHDDNMALTVNVKPVGIAYFAHSRDARVVAHNQMLGETQ